MRQIVKHCAVPEVVSVDELHFKESKIYIAINGKDIYKLHRIEDGSNNFAFAFIHMSSSVCWSNGSGTSKNQIRSMINLHYEIFEFDTLKEMIDFMYKRDLNEMA